MDVTKSIVTLTTSESKRLIAKGVTHLPEVQRAFRQGIIGLPLCSSNAYVYEELTGISLDVRAAYCCGYIFAKGFCATNFTKMHREVVFVEGKEEHLRFPQQNLLAYISRMTHNDIIIKSGNILDKNKKAAVLSGEPDGGEFGNVLPYILSKGIQTIIPMTLNKTAPVEIDHVVPQMGMGKISLNMSHGMVCGMLPMPGKVITEIEALEVLTGVAAIPIAMNGIGSGEGCVTLLLSGETEKVKVAWNLVSSIKGEPNIKPISRNCLDCSVVDLGVICPITEKINTRNMSSND